MYQAPRLAAPTGMSARAILSWFLRSMDPSLGPNSPTAVPLFAVWPGAPVCWARGLLPRDVG